MKRFKSVLSAFIALVLLMTLFAVNDSNRAFADESDVLVKITTNASQVKAGDTLTATLSIEKNPGVAGLTVRYNYDKAVLSLTGVSVPSGSAYSSAIIKPDEDMLDDTITTLDQLADGTVGFAFSEAKNKKNTGDILVVTFKVKENATIGDSTLSYEYLDATSGSGTGATKLSISGTEGKFTVLCTHSKTTQKVTKEATCTEKGVKSTICDICGKTVSTEDTAALGHDFGGFVETKAATCTEAGERTATCNRCGETKTEPVEALGHDFGDFVKTKAATCTEAGEQTATCNRCGETKTEPVEALGHDFGDFVETKAATCTEAGEQTATCNRCGETKTEPVAALGHKVDEYTVTKEPTCTEKGEKEGICSVCGETVVEEIAALGHKYDSYEITKVETEEEDGEIKRTCSVCGDTVTEVIPKIEAEHFELTEAEDDSEVKKEYYVGDTVEFNADIYSIAEGEEQLGDIRYVPVAFSVNSKTGKWESAPYTITVTFDEESEYKIVVEYVRQVYTEEGWISGDKTYSFETVLSAVLKNEETTANPDDTDTKEGEKATDKTPTETTTGEKPGTTAADNKTAPKTGDSAAIMIAVFGIMIASVTVILVAKRKREEV